MCDSLLNYPTPILDYKLWEVWGWVSLCPYSAPGPGTEPGKHLVLISFNWKNGVIIQ